MNVGNFPNLQSVTHSSEGVAKMMADYEMFLKPWGNFVIEGAGHGGEVLKRLFQKHPDTLKLFPEFKSISYVELGKHGKTLLEKLGELLWAKGNHAAIIQKLATSDVKTDKIIHKYFRRISGVLMEVMKDYGFLSSNDWKKLERVMDNIAKDI
ncbi:myoglobin isoform X1 [Carassius auratus]|uniref:Myoglobin n=2 Tax=Carassius auratus TaxID=7957 RepID=A0A6P6KRD9_CARAU|nr:myoglobin-like isoform X1 [Carassius auratus]